MHVANESILIPSIYELSFKSILSKVFHNNVCDNLILIVNSFYFVSSTFIFIFFYLQWHTCELAGKVFKLQSRPELSEQRRRNTDTWMYMHQTNASGRERFFFCYVL